MLHKKLAKIPLPPIHWPGEDGLRHQVTMQGGLLTWRLLQAPSSAPTQKKSGGYTTFSHGARFRLLKVFASLDWDKAKPALFITLTFPPKIRPQDKDEMNKYRFLFFRHIEKLLARQVCCIWRTEWKPRLSGENVGEYYPHFHLMLFNVFFIHHAKVNYLWRKSIGYFDYVRTETKRMKAERQAGYYIAKYCAKIDPSLVIDVNLNNIPSGKHWGVHRRELLPREPLRKVRLPDCDLVDECVSAAMEQWPDLATCRDSFTLMGPLARKIMAMISAEIDVAKNQRIG